MNPRKKFSVFKRPAGTGDSYVVKENIGTEAEPYWRTLEGHPTKAECQNARQRLIRAAAKSGRLTPPPTR